MENNLKNFFTSQELYNIFEKNSWKINSIDNDGYYFNYRGEIADYYLNISFKKAGLSRQKIEYLNGIIFNKNLLQATKKDLKKLSAEEYYDLLISIKGIGPWSIEMSRIFFIGDPDIFSILDLGLKNAHKKMFNIESYDESFYKEFSPYRSYMCLFMWRVLEDENVTI